MKRVLSISFLLFLLLLSNLSKSQERIFTAGFQFKPIFSSSLLNTGKTSIAQNKIDFSISQKHGYNFGMTLRRGFTKHLSMEFGINFTKRKFDLSITDSSSIRTSDFTIVGYEIPLQGMVFMQLNKNIFMNVSGGLSWDMYPSNIETHDDYFKNHGVRKSLFQLAALANLGFEYRTKKNGYFYLGSSYHLPLSYFYTAYVQYIPTQEAAKINLVGNYLTIDFRYYFYSEPLKAKTKKKKN